MSQEGSELFIIGGTLSASFNTLLAGAVNCFNSVYFLRTLTSAWLLVPNTLNKQ